jgi:hypothetical protein
MIGWGKGKGGKGTMNRKWDRNGGRRRGVEPLTMMFFLKGPLPRSGGGTGLMSKSSQNLAV